MGRIAGVTPEQTRERLVDAAARVVEQKGYEGATVAQIAREAGVTTGAIYAHYGSKAELLVDALRVHGDRATASLAPPGVGPDTADVLVALATSLATRAPGDASLLVEALLGSRRDPELAQVLSATIVERQERLAGLVGEGQARGGLASDLSPDVAARFALMLGLGSMLVAELDLPPVDQGDWSSFVRRLVATFTEEPAPA